MRQINLESYCIFKNHCSTFHDTSASEDAPPVYVSASTKDTIDFDEVTREFCSENISKAADALSCLDRKLHFIEFKSGRVQSYAKRKSIYGKAKYSREIFCKITKVNDKDFSNNVIFVLVYDLSKNTKLQENEQYIDGESVAKLRFHAYISSRAKQHPKIFGIMDLQGVLYKKVWLCKKEDFDIFVGQCNVGMVADLV